MPEKVIKKVEDRDTDEALDGETKVQFSQGLEFFEQ